MKKYSKFAIVAFFLSLLPFFRNFIFFPIHEDFPEKLLLLLFFFYTPFFTFIIIFIIFICVIKTIFQIRKGEVKGIFFITASILITLISLSILGKINFIYPSLRVRAISDTLLPPDPYPDIQFIMEEPYDNGDAISIKNVGNVPYNYNMRCDPSIDFLDTKRRLIFTSETTSGAECDVGSFQIRNIIQPGETVLLLNTKLIECGMAPGFYRCYDGKPFSPGTYFIRGEFSQTNDWEKKSIAEKQFILK